MAVLGSYGRPPGPRRAVPSARVAADRLPGTPARLRGGRWCYRGPPAVRAGGDERSIPVDPAGSDGQPVTDRRAGPPVPRCAHPPAFDSWRDVRRRVISLLDEPPPLLVVTDFDGTLAPITLDPLATRIV